MPARQIAIRAASMVLLLGGAGAFAVNAGLVPGIGSDPHTAQAPTPVSAPAHVPAPTPVPAALVATGLSGSDTQAPTVAPAALTAPAMTDSAAIQLPRQAIVPVVDTVDAAPEQPPMPGVPEAVNPDRMFSAFGLPCGLSVTATAMPGAMVALDIMAPCQPEALVIVEHSGLTLTAQTDTMGLITMDIPGFETPAFFTVELPDGSNQAALVGLPDLPDYDRVAVQWEGDSQLELHAMELGAAFGDPGHIWEETPGSLEAALAGQSGFLTEIGDATLADGRAAQVYTFPRSTLRAGDAVRLSVDAPITTGNCGQSVTAHTLETTNSGAVEVTPISLIMPGCDAVGDYLVLQNLLRDLRLASN